VFFCSTRWGISTIQDDIICALKSVVSNYFGLECLKLLISLIFYLALATGIIAKTFIFIENLLMRCEFPCSLICYRKKMKVYSKRWCQYNFALHFCLYCINVWYWLVVTMLYFKKNHILAVQVKPVFFSFWSTELMVGSAAIVISKQSMWSNWVLVMRILLLQHIHSTEKMLF